MNEVYVQYYKSLVDLATNVEKNVKMQGLANTIGKIVNLCRTVLDVSPSSLRNRPPISSSSLTSPTLSLVAPSAFSAGLIGGAVKRSREARQEKLTKNKLTEVQNSLLKLEIDLIQHHNKLSRLKKEHKSIKEKLELFESESNSQIKKNFNNISEFYSEINFNKDEVMLYVNQNGLQGLNKIKEELIKKLTSVPLGEMTKEKAEVPPASNLLTLEKELASVQGLLEKRKKNSASLTSKEFEIAEANSSLVDKIEVDYNSLNTSEDELSDLEKIDENNFVIFKEILCNRIANRICYGKQIENFVKLNKERIIKYLTGIKDDLSSINIEFSMRLLDAEGHNGGKRPVHITLSMGDRKVELICKPRDASIDQAVIETFEKMNKTNLTLKPPLLTVLPKYKIIQPQKGQGWQGLESIGTISIWEYVKGSNVKELTKTLFKVGVPNVYQFAVDKKHIEAEARKERIIQNLENHKKKEIERDLNEAEKKDITKLASDIEDQIVERLKKQVLEIDAIFTEMSITDQHTENILYVEENIDQILSADDVKNGKGVFALIPIDLENRQFGPSHLETPKASLDAMRQEIKGATALSQHIKDHNESSSHYLTRLVLIKTDELAHALWSGWQNLSRLEGIANNFTLKLKSTIQKKFREYKLIDSESEFRKKFTEAYLEDILNYDIPYFTVKDGKIYYGLPEKQVALCERQTKINF